MASTAGSGSAVAVDEWERPLSALLREHTAEVHTNLENSDGAKHLTSGKLDETEYVRYLMMLYQVYE
jgi:heme oxygenase